MHLPSTPIELLFSTNTAKALRVKKMAPASPHPGNFLQQWRIELVDDRMGRKAILITNLATLFTFLIPQEPGCSLPLVLDTFLMRLGFSLLASNPPIEWKPSQIVPARGNPRAVIGSMNDMISMLTFRRDSDNLYGEDAEDFLNETPFSMIKMNSPGDEFLRRLQDLVKTTG
jgi:hypothetical protein